MRQLLFADDTVLIADSKKKLERLVEEFRRVCKRRKLKVNLTKSKVMNIMMDGQVLKEVAVFKYLGSLVMAEGGVEAHVQ